MHNCIDDKSGGEDENDSAVIVGYTKTMDIPEQKMTKIDVEP